MTYGEFLGYWFATILTLGSTGLIVGMLYGMYITFKDR